MLAAGKRRRVKAAALLFEPHFSAFLNSTFLTPQFGAFSGPFFVIQFGAQAGQSLLLLAAAGLDFVVGDPWGWPHPVRVMGWVIKGYSDRMIRWGPKPVVMKLAGVGLGLLLIGGTFIVSAAGLRLLATISPVLRWVVECVLLASCFAGRSLRQAAADVLQPLSGLPFESEPEAARGLVKAREKLALYVGRDTAQLSVEEVHRAVLETVSENAIDGVLAPLFYAICGAMVGWAAPVALAYKAASTLDSMVGYREAPYADLGWFSAQFEDRLTWLPCRLSVLTVALLSGLFSGLFSGPSFGLFFSQPRTVLRLCWRDARADPSPNAGWSECAYAAALGVQLGGENTYRGKVKLKPTLGEATRPITADVVTQALALTRWSFLIGLAVGIGMLWL